MGAALGLAITLPAAQALRLFAALGLGMALPYLAASAWPGWSARAQARALDGPSSAMAFPMLATVVWLVWVLGQQAGIDGVLRTAGQAGGAGLGGWLCVRPTRAPARGAWRVCCSLGLLCAVAALGGAVAGATPVRPHPRRQPRRLRWQPGLERAASEQRPAVFVDFTAAWCVTCQFNERIALSDAHVLSDLKARRGGCFVPTGRCTTPPSPTSARLAQRRAGLRAVRPGRRAAARASYFPSC